VRGAARGGGGEEGRYSGRVVATGLTHLAILLTFLATSLALAEAQKKVKAASGPVSDAMADSAPPTSDLSNSLGRNSGQYNKFLQLLHDTHMEDQVKAPLPAPPVAPAGRCDTALTAWAGVWC
jgi:hypothetical protein